MIKSQLLEAAKNPAIAMTGRLESWLRNSEGRLPVSCTVLDVEDVVDSWYYTSKALRYAAGVALYLNSAEYPDTPKTTTFRISTEPIDTIDASSFDQVIRVNDSMEESVYADHPGNGFSLWSIEEAWELFYRELQKGNTVLVDLSRLRPAGSTNTQGLVASGAESFADIFQAIAQFCQDPYVVTLAAVYSKINEVLRRGGTFKNGAITLHLDYTSPDAASFIRADIEKLPWVKRCLGVDKGVLDSYLLDLVCRRIAAGHLWLAKFRYDHQGARLLSNVCLEIAIRSRCTCLLQHVNLGAITVDEIPQAFEDTAKMLCAIHPVTGVGAAGIYMEPDEDKQVGVGVIGLASLLAIEGVSYRDLVEAWESHLDSRSTPKGTRASVLVNRLIEGLFRAAKVGVEHGMERTLTIAPTASCAYRYEDREGYTCTPEISPPVDRAVDRYSGTFGIQTYDHHPRVETALEVGYDLYFRLADCWQQTMEMTAQAHSISFNVWDTQPVNREFVERWIHSSLWTLYYRLPVQQSEALDKTTIQSCDLNAECTSCAE